MAIIALARWSGGAGGSLPASRKARSMDCALSARVPVQKPAASVRSAGSRPAAASSSSHSRKSQRAWGSACMAASCSPTSRIVVGPSPRALASAMAR